MFPTRSLCRLLVVATLAHASPLTAQTRVACVGDSITEGYGLSSPQTQAYPAQLQGLLGEAYAIGNFGLSGSTARKQGDKPYWEQAVYSQSTDFEPAIVLLMLGTNDAKGTNWNESSFQSDYAALVEHYLSANARVIVATPPKVFGAGAFDIDPSSANDVLVPLLRSLASERDWPLVDVFDVTADHAEWFPDNVHPTQEGAAAIAAAFAEGVRNLEAEAKPDTGASTSQGEETAATPSSSNEVSQSVSTGQADPTNPVDSHQGGSTSRDDSTNQTAPADPTHSSSIDNNTSGPSEPSNASVSLASTSDVDASSSSERSSSGHSSEANETRTTSTSAEPFGANATASEAAPRTSSGCAVSLPMKRDLSGSWLLVLIGSGFSVIRRRVKR